MSAGTTLLHTEAIRTGAPVTVALRAAAAEPMPDVPTLELESAGVILIYGRDEAAVEAGNQLGDLLDVTVLIEPGTTAAPGSATDFPVARGRIRTVGGHLGAFDVVVDDFAEPAPSAGPPRDGARSRCDIILDLSGGTALVSAPDLRDGYLRADPGNPGAVTAAVLRARDLVGIFEKPRYIAFDASLCAHSRSGIIGCTRCLDLCPAGAIAPAGEVRAHV